MPELKDFVGYGPTVILFLLFVIALKWLAPTIKDILISWADRKKEVKLRELEVSQEMAKVIGGLGETLAHLGETLRAIAVDQRRQTEVLEVMQRVNADDIDRVRRHIDKEKARRDE